MFSFLPQCTGDITERSGSRLAESLSLEGLHYFGPFPPAELANAGWREGPDSPCALSVPTALPPPLIHLALLFLGLPLSL